YFLKVDPQGNKWIGNDKDIFKYDGSNWVKFSPSDESFNTAAFDKSGIKWFGSDNGPWKYDGRTWTQITDHAVANSPINSIAVDSLNNKWLSTGNGLVKYDNIRWTVYNTSNSGIPSNTIESAAVDPKGNVWVGFSVMDSTKDPGGIAKYDGNSWTVFNKSNSGLPHNSVNSIVIDRQDNKWICTNGGGLAKFDDQSWTVYDHKLGFPDYVYSLAIDSLGNKWIGSDKLIKYDGQNITVYNASNSSLQYRNDVISEVAVDKYGSIWLGTFSGVHMLKGSGVLMEIENGNKVQPLSFQLKQNYPNPFNPTTTIKYSLDVKSNVRIKIFDTMGKVIAVLVNEEKPSGTHMVYFNAAGLASGIYYYQIETNGTSQTRKMILLK
ncbi:MAG: T9SS type A sorting domain-containing protein, partial [Syntrophothermus sp.]